MKTIVGLRGVPTYRVLPGSSHFCLWCFTLKSFLFFLALRECIAMRFGIPNHSWCPGLCEGNVRGACVQSYLSVIMCVNGFSEGSLIAGETHKLEGGAEPQGLGREPDDLRKPAVLRGGRRAPPPRVAPSRTSVTGPKPKTNLQRVAI